jgi:hypothetical protein
LKNSSKTTGRRALAALMGLAIAAAAAAPAQAATYTATGAGTQDKAVTFEVDVDAKAKKGKLKSAKAITRLTMDNAEFECSATGEGGRSDYAHTGLFEDPVAIAKNGKFEDVYEFEAGGYVIERYTLEGKVAGKGKSMIVSGTFQAEKGAGGIKFNNCSTGAVPFKVKAKL